MVSRHIVIHIDATRADSSVRRDLFSTNREGFKEGPVLFGILKTLRDMLEEDAELHAIERELTEKLAKQDAEVTKEQVKKEVARLLQEAGLKVLEAGQVDVAGGGVDQPTKRPRRRRPVRPDPLPTLPFPQVTRLQIVAPKPKLSVAVNDAELVLIETDADAEFDRRGLVMIRSEPESLELASKSDLRGGRMRWRLRPKGTESGLTGRITATLTKPDGSQLSDSIDFEILPAREEKSKRAAGFVPPFNIIPINPTDHPGPWQLAWENLPVEDPENEENRKVAYKPVRSGSGIVVYYSTIFEPYAQQVEKLKKDQPTLLEYFEANYAIWIGYHAILQESDRRQASEVYETEEVERLLDEDRARVARMEVKQAMRIAELSRRNAAADTGTHSS